jgi:hypothetical protein
VGGALDGKVQPTGFQFDALSLMRRFDRVDKLDWTSCASDGTSSLSPCVTLEGVACGEPLKLHVRAFPTDGVEAGLRRYHDGRVELT